jgi:hypothetical protein
MQQEPDRLLSIGGSYLFLLILKFNFCCVPEAAYQDSKQLFVSGATAYL